MLMRKIQKPRKNYTAVNYDQKTMIAETQAPESRVKTQNAETEQQLNLNIYLSKLFCNMMLIVCFQRANHLETLFS